MKIGKVDHTRTAVAKIEDNKSPGGFQYKDPGTAEDLQKRIDNRIASSKKMYNFFNSINVKQTNVSESDIPAVNKCIKDLNKTLNTVFFKKDNNNNNKIIMPEAEIIKGIKGAAAVTTSKITLKKNNEEADCIEYCLYKYLKKALRVEKDSLKAVIGALGENNTNPKNAIEKIIKVLEPDFARAKVNKYAEKSIKNQNMPVQNERGNLVLPNDNAKVCVRAQSEKEGLKQFLSGFADLDENLRMDYLRRLSRLIDLFFGTDEKASIPVGIYKGGKINNVLIPEGLTIPENVQTDDFDVWERHEERKENTASFVSVPDELIKDSGASFIDRANKTEECKKNVRSRIAQCYLYSAMVIAQDEGKTDGERLFFASKEQNMFWLRRIEYLTEKITDSALKRGFGEYKLQTGYISEKVWKEILNLISTKYISLGKAVFGYCMDDLFVTGKDKNMGKLRGNVDHISSFDYEVIKANETLQRETSVAVAFAANNLARATVDNSITGQEDFLLYDQKKTSGNLIFKEENACEETLRSVLQFFGGLSAWGDASLIKGSYPGNQDNPGAPNNFGPHICFLDDLRKILFALRNENFHFFTANINQGDWNTGLIGNMFEIEAAACVQYEKEKFESNNLPEFYSKEDLEKLFDKLYSKYAPRASQVPSFNRVFTRDKFGESLAADFGLAGMFTQDPNKKERWLGALYYAFKEIYYNCFIQVQDREIKDYFYEKGLKVDYNVIQNRKGESLTKEQRALKDFHDRYKVIEKNKSFSEICQFYMTEYNYQNSGNRRVKSTERQGKDPDIFEHYKMLLYLYIRKAFVRYIKEDNNVLKFLVCKKHIFDIKEQSQVSDAKKAFHEEEWQSCIYNNLINEVKKNPELQKWYVLGRFLNGKTLNQLAGSLRSYRQYAEDVKRRAEENKITLSIEQSVKSEDIDKAVEVLDMCRQLCSRVSNDIKDYFTDEEEYAKYVGKYVDLSGYEESFPSEYSKLEDFCKGIGIFADGQNPICNRNIIMSKLFGPDKIITECREKVGGNDIKKYTKAEKEIAGYKAKGTCRTEEEQEKLIEYQSAVNRVELRDVAEYGDMINALYGQLINWCYLRERDLMYFQLGFHYECLRNSSIKPADYIKVTLGDSTVSTVINNAILHQVATMYINGVGMLRKKDGDNYSLGKETIDTGGKISMFQTWTKKIQDSPDGKYIYNAGLEVFENLNEHDQIVDFRNRIDHFKYYAGNDTYGILDLYSEVFDRFFTYDDKYRKNVPNMLMNILLKDYHVIFTPSFSTGEKKVGEKNNTTKERAQIVIREKSLKADTFTYKKKDSNGKESTYELGAKSEDFLKTVARILYYPEKKTDPDIEQLLDKGSKKECSKKDDKEEYRIVYVQPQKEQPFRGKALLDVVDGDIRIAYVNKVEPKVVKIIILEDINDLNSSKYYYNIKFKNFSVPEGNTRCWLKVECVGHDAGTGQPQWGIIGRCISESCPEIENAEWEIIE